MRAIRTGVIVLAVTLAVYAVVDLGFGLFQRYENHLFPPDPNLVPGHRGEPYATSQFIIEGLELGGIMTIPGTNLTLMPIMAAKVSGIALDAEGKPLSNAMVNAVQKNSATMMGNMGAPVLPNGKFTINLTPGEYTLRVFGQAATDGAFSKARSICP